MMKSIMNGAVLAIPLLAAESALMLYFASFWGYRLDDGIPYLILASIAIALSSIPTTIRDRRFFLQYWGFGLFLLQYRFPFRYFPARRIAWLEGLAWSIMAILLLHLAWFLAHPSPQGILENDQILRWVCLMVIFSGILAALSWEYPPTQKPQRNEGGAAGGATT
jgi:hypothetical protein